MSAYVKDIKVCQKGADQMQTPRQAGYKTEGWTAFNKAGIKKVTKLD